MQLMLQKQALTIKYLIIHHKTRPEKTSQYTASLVIQNLNSTVQWVLDSFSLPP